MELAARKTRNWWQNSPDWAIVLRVISDNGDVRNQGVLVHEYSSL